MPATLSRIFGWSPPLNETFVEVDVPDQPLPPHLPIYHTAEPSSPASSTSTLSDSQMEQRSEAVRKGDPGWVARPRNEFILFRCDYVRKHTKEGGNKRNRRHPGQEAEKTLSKLAAEAWRALPQEERLYWREQANLERNDHARKYPDYRYRPKKSATARKRTSRSSGSMSAGVITNCKSIPAPALLNPITVSRSPSTESPAPMRLVERPGTLFLDNSLRKSTSVPLLPSHAVAVEHRNNWMPLNFQPIQSSLGSRMNPSGINNYPQPIHPSLHHSQSYDSLALSTPALSESMSIADSTSSSLINWNGEPPLLAPQPTSYVDPLPLPIHSNFGPGPMQLQSPGGPKFLHAVSGGYPSLRPNDVQWVPGAYQPTAPVGGLLMRTASGNGAESLMNGYRANVNLGVVPGEYLTSSAEMTPDEIFVMDRDEYFTSSYQ
ncbi:hypothetical protein EST38_g7672 [Candolleomyces aberdarensis]|uniref:HMG box domain-containing protein n=1 Tax=Candolleomyces aberdarensis TaxID=2316362 RepID=A0A4Q2DHW8_9AGAR|nr:hypothetical protein EST38_g7672 [Candolleomyces aberdarensis]